MTDPYEYRDLGKLLYEQLPADLQRRGVIVAVMPGAFGEAPIAIFTGPNGRSLEFPVQEIVIVKCDWVANPCQRR